MFSHQIFIGTAITVGVVLFHVSALVVLARMLTRLARAKIDRVSVIGLTFVLVLTVLFILAIHTVEAWFWAGVYLFLGEFSKLSEALYFSVVTSTTLGYGDLTLSESWQILGTFEAMGGLILFGTSTAFLFEVMRQTFERTR